MKAAMESLKEMADVNTVIGDPVQTEEGIVIVPISRVSLGFAAGGTEFAADGRRPGRDQDGYGDAKGFPFGGGSGAGVSVQPVGFLIVGAGNIRMLPVDGSTVERLLDLAPQVIDRVQGLIGQGGDDGRSAEGERGGKAGADAGELVRTGVRMIQQVAGKEQRGRGAQNGRQEEQGRNRTVRVRQRDAYVDEENEEEV